MAPPVVSFVVTCSPPIVFYVLLKEGEGTSLLPRRPVGTRTHHSHGSCRNFRTTDCPPRLCRASPAAPSRFPALLRDAAIVPSRCTASSRRGSIIPHAKLQRSEAVTSLVTSPSTPSRFAPLAEPLLPSPAHSRDEAPTVDPLPRAVPRQGEMAGSSPDH